MIINEHEAGICGLVKDLEESYAQSCAHNNTTPDDMKYFRKYVFVMVAMMAKQLNELEDRGGH